MEKNHNYHFCLFSFGWEDRKLHHNERSLQVYSIANTDSISNLLCKLAGKGKVESSPVVPALFPFADPYGTIMKVTPEDLLVFFCQDRSVKFAASLEKIYTRNIQRHSVWIFVGGDTPEVEFGRFKPDFETHNF